MRAERPAMKRGHRIVFVTGKGGVPLHGFATGVRRVTCRTQRSWIPLRAGCPRQLILHPLTIVKLGE